MTTAVVAAVRAPRTVSGGDIARVMVDVAEDGPRPGVDDGLGGGVERERRHHDIVAGHHPERAEGDRDCVGAVSHADHVPDAEIRRELRLECHYLRAEDEAAVVDHRPDPGRGSFSRRGASGVSVSNSGIGTARKGSW